MVDLKHAVCGLLVLCAVLAGGAAAADEFYSKTTLWEDGRNVGAVAISTDGSRVAFAFDDSTVRVRSTEEDAAAIADLAWQGGDAYFVAFSADGARLVMGTVDGAVRVWDVASARELATIRLPMPGAVWATFSPDAKRVVTAGADGTARVWEADGGRALEVLAGHAKEVQDAVFSADGSMIATASRDNTVRIWNAADGSARAVLEHGDEVNSAAFSPDGRRLVSGSDDGAAHVFDLASGSEIATLRTAENAEVTDARFSPDGARIVTGSDDRIVRVWNAAGGEPLAVLPGHLGSVRSVLFSADGARIFSTAHDATGRIWTRAPSTRMPDGVAGLWHPDFGDDPQAMPPELVREICLGTPLSIREDGLIVSFEGWPPDPPQAMMHLRCATDLTCQIFGGPPAQALEPQATAKVSVDGEIATICMVGDCRPFKRCPALTWTAEERASGYADAWEARVLRLQP
jgi:sugar lactone lactonase YvrE